ncbi:MAG: hypothetical protein ACKVQC_05510 [Elusimicrobiota bacterium]
MNTKSTILLFIVFFCATFYSFAQINPFGYYENINKFINNKFNFNMIGADYYIEYYIEKGRSKAITETGFVFFKKDTVFWHSIEMFNDSTGQTETRRVFIDSENIRVLKASFDQFKTMHNGCVHDRKEAYHTPNVLTKKWVIGHSINEWSILTAERSKNNNFVYNTYFKPKLFKTKCIGFCKNLRNRKVFNKFYNLLSKT